MTETWDKTKIVIRNQEEIDSYKKSIGFRKARKKRYGLSSSQRQKSTLEILSVF